MHHLFLSHNCYGCDRPVLDDPKTLVCPACRGLLHFLSLAGNFPRIEHPRFDRVYSMLAYEGMAARWIQRWKYHRELHHTRLFVHLFEDYEFAWDRYEALVPVPLHGWRNLRRGSNPSAILAQALGRRFGRPVVEKGLKRIVRGLPQVKHQAADRVKNIRGAFALNPRAGLCRFKTVLLIDDVVTTGATVNECAKVLKKAGTETVDVLTLARPL